MSRNGTASMPCSANSRVAVSRMRCLVPPTGSLVVVEARMMRFQLVAAFGVERPHLEELRNPRSWIIRLGERRASLERLIPLGQVRVLRLPDVGKLEIGHAVDTWHDEHVGERELLAHDPRPPVLLN